MKNLIKSGFLSKAATSFAAILLTLSLGGAALSPYQALGAKAPKDQPVSAPLPPPPPAPAPAPTPPPLKSDADKKQSDTDKKSPTLPALTTTPAPSVAPVSAVASLPAGIFKNSNPNVVFNLAKTGTTGVPVTAFVGANNSFSSPFSYLILWGDGNYIVTPAGTNSSNHTYNSPGDYTVIVMSLLDSNVVGMANSVVSVAQGAPAPVPAVPLIPAVPPVPGNTVPVVTPPPAPVTPPAPVLPPDLQINLPTSGTVGQPLTVSAQVNNISNPVAIAFSLGNGRYILMPPGKNTQSFSYSKTGNYFVTVTATVNGTTLTKTGLISVGPAAPIAGK